MLGDGPSLTAICTAFLGLGLLGSCLSLLRWWASVPIITILCIWGMVLLDDLYSEDLYPVYSSHPEFLYTATIVIVTGAFLPIVGIAVNFTRRLKKTK